MTVSLRSRTGPLDAHGSFKGPAELLACTWSNFNETCCLCPQAQARFAELNVTRLEAFQRASYAGAPLCTYSAYNCYPFIAVCASAACEPPNCTLTLCSMASQAITHAEKLSDANDSQTTICLSWRYTCTSKSNVWAVPFCRRRGGAVALAAPAAAGGLRGVPRCRPGSCQRVWPAARHRHPATTVKSLP